MLIVLLGVGCNPSHQPEQNNEPSSKREPQKSEQKVDNRNVKKLKVPLKLNENIFHSVSDWKSDEEILYITNNIDGSEIYTYNIFTGETSLFFESISPIVQVKANNDHSLFVVHTSPTSYQAELILLNSEAEIVHRAKTDSYELQYTWNPFNQNQLFVTSFNEDWTYQTYQLNVAEKEFIKSKIDIPFIQWLPNNEISYLKWDQDAPSLTAPLYIYDMETQQETLISSEVVSNTNFVNNLTTFELIDQNGSAVVRFYDLAELEQLKEMPTRLVSLYSEWAIPNHDMDNKANIFYMFEVNEKKTSFSLISFDLGTGEKEKLFDNVENLPFKLSPNGEFALYGARYEKIIYFTDKSINELVLLN